MPGAEESLTESPAGRLPLGLERPDPSAAEGSAAFVASLRRLKEMTGLSYRALERRASEQGDYLPRSTLVAALRGDRLPPVELVAAFTRACGCATDAISEWLQARRDAAVAAVIGTPPQPPDTSGAPATAAGTAAGAASALPGYPTVPRQLPADIRGFVARDEALAALEAMLSADAEREPRAVISAITGTAGVGKTALAIHWAHQVADHFPDGQLYVDLRGFDPGRPPMEPAEAIRGFLDAMRVLPEQIPAGLDAQAGLYRSLLAGRRMLVLLDNAVDAPQVRPLLPGGAGCRTVVTSRSQLSSLVAADGAELLSIDLLSHAEARQLLARRLGPGRLAADPAATDEIISRCARLPLALAIIAARAAANPEFPLRELARELREASIRLDALSDPDPSVDVRAAFDVSVHLLSTAAARLFRLLALHPGPEISTAAAAHLLGVQSERVRALLVELAHAHLVREHTPGRYALHDLLRAYAAELLHRSEPVDDQPAAVGRMLDFYLHTAHAASSLLYPGTQLTAPEMPHSTVEPEHLDRESAMAWYTLERPVLVALITQAAPRHDPYTWRLAQTVSLFLQRRGHWQDWLDTQSAALEAGRRLDDPEIRARSHRLIGGAHIYLGAHEDAYTHLRCALAQYQALGDRFWQARVHIDVSVALAEQDRHREGISHAREALKLCRAEGDLVGQAGALNGMGWMYAQLGAYQRTLDYCRQALALQEQAGEQWRQFSTWDSLGYAYHHLGDHQRASECYQRALDLSRANGDRHQEATALSNLGDTHHAAGEFRAACQAWRQALVILRELNHPDVDRVREQLASVAPG